MSEWTVVTVVIALVGLVGGVVAPLLKLNSTITRLSTIVDSLEKNVSSFTTKNSEAHGRIWDELTEHGERLGNHETRITVLEHK